MPIKVATAAPLPAITVSSLLFFLALSISCCRANVVETVQVDVDPSGTLTHPHDAQPDSSSSSTVHATFVNLMEQVECGLYWMGNSQAEDKGGPRLFYGPLSPRGGQRSIEGYPGQIFALLRAGTYEKLAEFILGNDNERFVVTDEDYANHHHHDKKNDASHESMEREKAAIACRSLSDCETCTNQRGCGWSIVRRKCFLVHPIATVNSKKECIAELEQLDDLDETADHAGGSHNTKSAEAWLNEANALVLAAAAADGGGPRLLRKAYRALEQGAKAAEKVEAMAAAKQDTKAYKAALLTTKKIHGALLELSAKLEAVFDDTDAAELLESTRHEALADIHPDMSMVDRRTMSEAREYVARGEPVVIIDAFSEMNAVSSPVVHKWTLEYLRKQVFFGEATAEGSGPPPRFNVAADASDRCCRYFEPRSKAEEAGYPYPFAPSTHLYRDTFDGFVKTVRKTARTSSNRTRILHYLHEIVMNGQGEAVVAGAAAPPRLKADLDAITKTVGRIANDEPFFGGFASAKVWIGQRGIVMPIHYDATDNLYVMAWGRKRAIIGEPGQLDALYRYPNGHPLAGSSQVNLTAPDLVRHPRFKNARLREVIVGPGDVLYLPAWWWHQFEQPFEDTAALNLWSRDRDQAPEASMRDLRVREHLLSDQLERSVVQLLGNEAGMVLEALAKRQQQQQQQGKDKDASMLLVVDRQQLDRANKTLHAAAEAWREQVIQMPGGHPKAAQPAAELVAEYLELSHSNVSLEWHWPDWRPGMGWDLSRLAKLPRELRECCKSASESSPFMSHCA